MFIRPITHYSVIHLVLDTPPLSRRSANLFRTGDKLQEGGEHKVRGSWLSGRC
jgi:hypothetical protein